MPNGKMPSWEEWNEQLTEEQRKYSLYKILQDITMCMEKYHSRIESLEVRKKFDTGFSGAMGFLGGVAVWVGKKLFGL